MKIYGIVVSIFSVSNKDNKEKFFKESFLLANVKSDVILGMLFLTMSNADIDFQARDLQWRSYIIKDVFSTIKRVELIEKKEFAVTALDLEYKVFIVYVAALDIDLSDKIHFSNKAQIAHLKADEASIKVASKYANFADIFSTKLAIELLKYTRINNYTIKLVDDWQTSYGPIYNLSPVELETFKMYIKNNLANSFIKPTKFATKASIFFDKKPNGSL